MNGPTEQAWKRHVCKKNLITDYFNSQAGMLVPFFLYLCGICHRELNAFELPQSVSQSSMFDD